MRDLSILLALTAIACYATVAVTKDTPRQEQTMTVNKGISKTYTAKVTAYCPCEICCEEFADGKTSTGTSAYERGCAVDPKKIPYGTILEIDGYGLVRADDIGGAMTSYDGIQIDLRFLTHEEALEWGKKYMEIKELTR